MPTVFKEKGYRFFFVMADLAEPMHIHVVKENAIAKFWLNPVRLASSKGFRTHQLREVLDLIKDNKNIIEDAWNERLRNRY